MTDPTHSRTVVLTNTAGLHLRAANLFVQMAVNYESKVEVVKDDQRVDGKSIMNLLMLGAVQGSELRIEATGNDAEAALGALAELVAKKFYEDDQEQA
jgi:phosphocarrier protein HPr